MVIGEHQFNPMRKVVAFDCDYNNPSTNTGHDAWRCNNDDDDDNDDVDQPTQR